MVATCRAIVGAVVGLGVEEEDRKRTWMADADDALRRGSVHTARAILAHSRTVFPGKKSIWRSRPFRPRPPNFTSATCSGT